MRGWSARRRSGGEIINATLLEVFLAIAFIVFALAVFEAQRANAAESALASVRKDASDAAVKARELAAARDSVRRLLAASAGQRALADSVRALTQQVRQLQFNSRYAPDCEEREGRAGEAPWITVTLRGEGAMQVRMRTARFGFGAGDEVVLRPEAFAARFAAVRTYSEANGCRFPAQIVDTDATSKAAYKQALTAVSSTFRLRGFLR